MREYTREEVWALYRELRSTKKVAEKIGKSESTALRLVRQMPDRDEYRGKPIPTRVSDEDILSALRKAAQDLGSPPPSNRYHLYASEHKLPAYYTVTKRFGSWQDALSEAGIEPNPGRIKYGLTHEQAVRAVAEFFKRCGSKRQSYEAYEQFARESSREFPSASSIRMCGPWNDIADEAEKLLTPRGRHDTTHA